MILETSVTRADLVKVLGNSPKVVKFFEQLAQQVVANTSVSTANTDATTALQDATVVTLSPNATFTNERILAVDAAALTITDNGAGGTVVLGLVNLIVLNGGFACAFNLQADTNVDLPVSGKVPSSDIGPYADDTAAGLAGVQVGDIYKGPTGSVVWRQV